MDEKKKEAIAIPVPAADEEKKDAKKGEEEKEKNADGTDLPELSEEDQVRAARGEVLVRARAPAMGLCVLSSGWRRIAVYTLPAHPGLFFPSLSPPPLPPPLRHPPPAPPRHPDSKGEAREAGREGGLGR